MNETNWMHNLKNRRCAVVGLGISNLPLIDFLLDRGATVTARDRKTENALGEIATALRQKGVRLIAGEDYLAEFDEEIIFRSPGLRPDLLALREAVERGAILTSEMELFLHLTPATVIGITGSDGKTTTTTLTGLMLEAACRQRGHGRVYVGGNIGKPLLPLVGEMTGDDFAVLELSSFQLQGLGRSPHRAAITNISPNHLDWHTDMEEYVTAKRSIFSSPQCERLVVNAENARTAALGDAFSYHLTRFSSTRHTHGEICSASRTNAAVYEREGVIYLFDGVREEAMLEVREILVPGQHNLENYMTAIALTAGLVPPACIREVAASFHGVKHRLEVVRTHRGVTYYNSSIDSSPSRTAAALAALAPIRPIVICGGYDKKIPFAPLAEALARHAGSVILTGQTAPRILEAIRACPEAAALTVLEEPIFADAVERAHKLARPGDTVLLSPACASFDAFRNFEERGETFRALVNRFE